MTGGNNDSVRVHQILPDLDLLDDALSALSAMNDQN
jgi:hypothetical protein